MKKRKPVKKKGVMATPVQPELVQKDVVKNQQVILHMRIRRTANSLVLYLKSDVFEQYFKNNSRTIDWNGLVFYENPARTKIPEFNLHQFNGLLFTNGYPHEVNMTWLRAKGLTDGIEIPINQVASTVALKEFVKAYRDAAVMLFNSYIRPCDINLEITSREIDV